jgi:ribosomal protein L29
VEKENKKAGTADDLQKELDNWKNALSSETPQAAAEKITNADRIKDELNK